MTEMAEIVTRFSELVRHRISEESELRPETSAAVPHHIKVSLSQVKVHVLYASTRASKKNKVLCASFSLECTCTYTFACTCTCTL